MSNYYGSGYPPQQAGGSSSGGAGSGGYYGGQQQQQQYQQNQSSAYSGYGGGGAQQQQQHQQWQAPNQQQQPGMNMQQPQQQHGMNTGMQPQQQQPGMNMQQQPQQQQNIFNPASAAMLAAAAASGNPALMDGMAKQGEMWLKGGIAKMIPGLEYTMLTLRTYFAVDNRYVKRKMIKIIFPFMDKSWSRLQTNDPSNQMNQQQQQYQQHNGHLQSNYALPNSDENAPDLYIPTMSFITYVLLCALLFGTAGKFNPEVIPDVATRCVVTGIIEVVVFKIAFMSMNVLNIDILDIFSYVGYKYFGLCINMIVGLIFSTDFISFIKGQRGYWISFVWTSAAAAYFMLKTMANTIPLTTNPNGPKREIMVFIFALLQLPSMWIVSQTKLLD